MVTIATSTVLALLLGWSQTASVPNALPSVSTSESTLVYDEKDLHALVSPSVFRVYRHIKGEITIRPYKIDLKTLTAIENSGKPLTKTLDLYVSGTGFVVSENGLVLTNAHVVSNDVIEVTAAAEVLQQVLFKQLLELSAEPGFKERDLDAVTERFTKMQNDPAGQDATQFRRSLMSFVSFTDAGSELVLLRQGTQVPSSDLDALLRLGTHKVRVVYVDADWVVSRRDVAILQIDDPLWFAPAVSLSTSTPLAVNTEISVYGFPGSTDMGVQSGTNVTVTRGRITSTKDVPNTSITMYQTDAKISQGSSGGPAVDMQGRVVGIVTLETGTKEGDNFGFVLPITVVQDALSNVPKVELVAQYQSMYRSALEEKSQRHCKRAIEGLGLAEAKLMEGEDAIVRVKELITECERMIEQGLSIDDVSDEYREMFRSVSTLTWVLSIGGGVLVIVVVIGGILFIRRIRNEEKEIDELQEQLMEQRADVQVHAPVPPQSTPNEIAPQSIQRPPHDPSLVYTVGGVVKQPGVQNKPGTPPPPSGIGYHDPSSQESV